MLVLPELYENELTNVRTTFGEELRTSTATLARVESAKETVVDSPMPVLLYTRPTRFRLYARFGISLHRSAI